MTAPSTTPATAAACPCAYQVAGKRRARLRLAMNHREGATASATTVSSGDSTAITASETANSNTFPIIIGSMNSRLWINWRSLVARPTTWPVLSSSCRRPSSRAIEPNIRVRRSC